METSAANATKEAAKLDGKYRGLVPGQKTWTLRQFDDSKPRLYYPHELLEKFMEYEEWMTDNPLYEPIVHQKTGTLINVPKMRAMTVKGFCLFAGLAQNSYYQYRNQKEYQVICKVIEDAIYVQKFEGAAAGLLNTGIIVRDLGLQEVVQHTVSDDRKTLDQLFPSIEDIEAIVIENTSFEEIKALNGHGNTEED